jgi:hypothetical protein
VYAQADGDGSKKSMSENEAANHQEASPVPSQSVSVRLPNDVTACDNVLAEDDDPELTKLAAEIRKLHLALQINLKICTKDKAAIGERVRRGHAKFLARGRAGMGFRRWVEEHCGFSHTTAYRYMRVFEECEKDESLLDLGVTELYDRKGIYTTPTSQEETPPHHATGFSTSGEPTVENTDAGDGESGPPTSTDVIRKNGRASRKGRSRTQETTVISPLVAPFVEDKPDGYHAKLSGTAWPGQIAALQADPKNFLRMLQRGIHLSLAVEE